jgi:hypothetical protein
MSERAELVVLGGKTHTVIVCETHGLKVCGRGRKEMISEMLPQRRWLSGARLFHPSSLHRSLRPVITPADAKALQKHHRHKSQQAGTATHLEEGGWSGSGVAVGGE